MEGFTELPGSNGNVLKKITREGSGASYINIIYFPKKY